MKQLFPVIVLLLGCYSKGFGQFQIHPDSSFYTFLDSFYTFLDSFYTYYQDDSTEGGIYNKVRRDVLTWGPRLAPTGNMQKANKAMLDYSRIYKTPTIATTNLVTGTIPIVFPTTYPGFPSPWTELGPTKNIYLGDGGRGMGQIHRLAFHPNYNGTSNRTLYAGSHYGGLYRTDDAGDNWYNFHTDRGLPMTSVGGVAVSANRVFVCTGNGDHGYAEFGINAHYDPLRGAINGANPIHTQGVYYIEDNGISTQWNPINGATRMINDSLAGDLLTVFEQGGTMRNIIVNPLDDHILLIATSQGIFRTENRGNTWKQVVVGPADPNGGFILDTEWRGLEYHPTDTNIVYASGKDIYKSVDGGRTWSSISNGQLTLPSTIARINLAVSPAASNHLYAYAVGGEKGHVYLYDGTNWHLQNNLLNPLDATPSRLGLGVSPANPQVVYVAGAIIAFSSTNVSTAGGVIFNGAHNGSIHDDIHAFEYSPDTATTELFVATHGGVSKSAGTGSGNFTALYDGLGVATIWSFDDFEGGDSLLSLAQQDVGVNVTIDKGDSWAQLRGGDGYGTNIDDQTGDVYTLSNSSTSLNRLRLEPYSYIPTIFNESTGIPAGGAPSTYPAETHPKNDSLYFGFSELYLRKSNFRMDSLIAIDTFGGTLPDGNPGNAGNCNDLESPDPNIIWASYWDQQPVGSGPIPPGVCIVSSYVTILEKWEKKSNLASFQAAMINRRIQELAFSEDASNYTYVATLGDNHIGARRADFYVNNADSLGCDTCFVIKTNNLPIDTIAQALTFDPNPITGLAVDPLDGRRVWASFSGYSKDIKVYYSEDAGDTWTSYDDTQNSLANLNVPINNIVYQRGTNDRLYIATDVGIYVREGTGNWLRYGDDFPNVRTTELKINYCSGKLRAATFGRGAWEADLLPTETSIDYRSFRTITGIETWNTNKNMVRDIKVKAGAILTLDSMTLNMPKDGLIVVEPGGLLVVDSSIITNLCGETWQGIQVWGNSNLSQVGSNQGRIILTASTLEYAKNAISPWEVGNFPNPSTGTGGTGGIIAAENSTFLNNWRSVDFMRYNSPTGAKEQSHFYNCTFTVNDDYRSFNGDTIPFFLGHISMWSVGGTAIKGCTFKDERSNKAGNLVTGGSFGLQGLAASPKVSRRTFPSKRTRFEGLERAIELGGGRGTNYTTAIDECTFVDNEQSVIIRAHNHAVIIRDSFEMGGFVSANPNSYFVEEYGLGLINTTSFNVEQNYFISNNNNDQTVGSWVEASGSAGNAIRNNQYDNLTGGNLAHGHNGRDSVNLFGGLEYHCNQNANNDYDFTVLANIASNAAPANIKSTQGRISQACRNTFSASVQAFPSQAHFYNYNTTAGQLGAPVRYYYTPNNTNEIPDAALLFNTNRQVAPQGILSFCAENYTGTGTFKVTNGEGEIVSLTALKENYTTDLEYYNLLKAEYDEISAEDSTARSNKASELAGASQKLFFWANQVIQYYANDTIPQNDSLEAWIQKKPGVEAQYELVEHYWKQGRYADALDQIDYIAASYSLDSLALKNHSHYKDLKELLQTAYDDGRMEANLEKTEVDALEVIANAKWGFAAVQASDILKFFYYKGTLYYPTLPNMNPIEGRAIVNTGNGTASFVKEPTLMGAPNPAINWVDLYYELPEELKAGHLIVTSTTGAKIAQVELRNNSGQLMLNTKDWVSGIYFATLFSEGQEAKTFKIIIQK